MKRDRYRFEHRCFGKRKIFRQAIKDARRNGDIFRKSSGTSKLGAGHSQDLAVVAQIHISTTTVVAGAAKDGRVEGDSVAFGEAAYSVPHGGNCSGSFVPHHYWRNAPARGAVVTVDVAAADAASGHAHEDFTAARRWLRKCDHFQMLVFRKQKRLHRCLLSFFRERLPASRE